MRVLGTLRLLWALAIVTACGADGPSSPAGAGVITFALETPHTDDGALVITVNGGVVDSMTAIGGHRAYMSATVDAASILLAGTIDAGPLLRIYVPDIRRAASYTAVASQVAARATYVLRDPAAYRLTRQ